jgi:thiamine biosynthesis protein ThiS
VFCDARHTVRAFAPQTKYGAAVPTIVVNGESRATQEGQTVATLLRELGLDPRQVAVERNREIVPRAEHAQAVLADGDQLEIVTFVGGG